jgi:predicted kinase
VRKTHADVPLHGRADPATRERLYTETMSDATYATLRARAVRRARQRRGTVLDATYSRPEQREALRTALRAAEVPFVFVGRTATDDVLKRRLRRRTAAAATASDARASDFNQLSERYQAPDALEDPRHVQIGTEGAPDDTTLAILKTLIRFSD